MATKRIPPLPVRTIEGPVVGSRYTVATISDVDQCLRSIAGRGREWDRDRDVLLDQRLILMLEEITGINCA